MKCGTTTLHHFLRQHPDVFVPEIKEGNFLKDRVITPDSLLEYEAGFETGYLAQGEICPGYIDLPELIAEHYPDTKIVIMVRDPVERMISHMRHNWRNHDNQHVATMSWPSLIERIRSQTSPEHAHDVIRLGMYRNRLTPFLERFSQVRVVATESLTTDFEQTYIDLCRFINVHPFLPNGVLRYHTSDQMKRPARPLSDSDRLFFREVFADSYLWLEREFGITFAR